MNHNFTISTYKTNLKEILEKINFLRTIHNDLSSSQNYPNSTNINLAEIQNAKNRIDVLLSECEKPILISEMKKKLNRRCSKRKNWKKRRAEMKATILKRSELHKQIDNSLAVIKKNESELLARKEAAKHSALILTKINQKKSEALKYIKLIKSLKELRTLRQADKQIADPVEELWNVKSSQLLALWEDTLDEYLTEESHLKSILAFDSKSLEDQWREVLFGDKERDKRVSKVSDFFEFFTIRRTWDSFLVPDDIVGYGSSIPNGWVLPPNQPNDKWSSYLFK